MNLLIRYSLSPSFTFSSCTCVILLISPRNFQLRLFNLEQTFQIGYAIMFRKIIGEIRTMLLSIGVDILLALIAPCLVILTLNDHMVPHIFSHDTHVALVRAGFALIFAI